MSTDFGIALPLLGCEGCGVMVRPSAASLNSLAEVLRQARSLYSECRSILNYLDGVDSSISLYSSQGPKDCIDGVSVNKDEDCIHQTVLEPVMTNHRRIV